MFTPDDAGLLAESGSWEKLQAVQEAFFPKLGAMQTAANKLIYNIYGIDVNATYGVMQAPTRPSRKNQPYNAKRRKNDVGAQVGLRGKGRPSHLTQPDGTLCQVHFALLAFSVQIIGEEALLGILFSPYLLNYHEYHRIDLSDAVFAHNIGNMMVETASMFDLMWWRSHDLPIGDLLEQEDAWFYIYKPLRQCDIHDLAAFLLLYAGCFPMLDLFTRLSNGDEVFYLDGEPPRVVPVNRPGYEALFLEWQKDHQESFLQNFHIEPITAQEVWQSEALTRSLFEEMLGHDFPKSRPEWLKVGRNNAALELDGYCQALRLAFEYQGEYHYMEVPVHHQSRTLKEVQKADALKMKTCKKHHVDLIQVPYWEKGNRGWICQALRALERNDIYALLGNEACKNSESLH
jgi:hypothetical protein